MKQNFLKLALCAMALLPIGAWADNVLSARSANGELFYTSWASGLTYGGTKTVKTGGTDTNGWSMNNTIENRHVGCTLSGSTYAEGDVISVEFYADGGSYTDIFYIYTSNAANSTSVATISKDTKPTTGEIYTVSYTIPSESALIGQSTLYIGKGAQNQSIRKVTITRSGADDLRPNTLTGKKTWSFDAYDSKVDSKFVNDDLFYSQTNVALASYANVSGHTKALNFTTGLNESAGYLNTVSAIRTIMFVVPAGTGEVEVLFANTGSTGRSLKYNVGGAGWTAANVAAKFENGKTLTFPYSVTKETEIWIGASGDQSYVSSITVNPNKKSVAFGTLGYATFGSPCAIDLTEVDNVTAYIATSVGENVVLKSVTGAIPANTGLLLQGPTSGSVDIPFTASASDLSETNLLHAATTSVLSSDYTNVWILTANSANDGVEFNKMVSGSLAAGKAYLVIDDGGTASARSVVFEDGETTGISNVKVVREEGIIYNLNGTRIQNPGKGIYVKDGKKLIVK